MQCFRGVPKERNTLYSSSVTPLFSIAAITMDYALGTYIVLFSMHFIATLTPALAVSVRRLHDTGKKTASGVL